MLEEGSKDWWSMVQSMPNCEALQMMQDYRDRLLHENIGTPTHHSISIVLGRLKEEIKRIHKLQDDGRWYKAASEVLPPELFEQVLSRKRMYEMGLA